MLNIFALAFPLLFIFHDLEEIIGMKRFVNRNADMLQRRYPFLYKRLRRFTTEGFALAVMEELVVFSCISTIPCAGISGLEVSLDSRLTM